MLVRWTCHESIGLVTLPASELGLLLDLDAEALDLSHQHRTCQFEAGPSAQLHS